MKLGAPIFHSSSASLPYLADPKANYSYVPTLDGLRAVSIMAVLLHHICVPRIPGGYGVFLFFIVSGFLITRLLFAESAAGVISIKNFYKRRFFRLYPVLCVFIFTSSTLMYLRYGDFDLNEMASVLFYYVNFLVVYRELHDINWQFPAIKVFWSLSVEEHYYILFPFAFYLLRTPHRIAALALAIIISCAALRYIVAASNPELVGSHYFGMLTQYRIDSIAFGVLLAAICEIDTDGKFLRSLSSYFSLSLSLIVFVSGFIFLSDPALKTSLRWPLMGFPVLVFMSALLFSPKYRISLILLNSSAFVWIGRLSYSLYVWHMLAAYVALSFYQGVIGSALGMLLSFILATASYFLVEQPMIRWGRGARTMSGPRAADAST